MLESGTIIRIKSASQISKTLTKDNSCKNVFFDKNMYTYCGYTCSIVGHNGNGTYKVEEKGPSLWNWLPEWFDVIDMTNDFWNNKSVEQRSLCLALYRQALSDNMPYIERLDQGDSVFTIKEKGGFNYTRFPEDNWGTSKIAGNLVLT